MIFLCSSPRCGIIAWSARVCIRVNAAPNRRSSSIRAETALACASSRGIGLRAALIMCTLSILLNLALHTCMPGLAFKAISRISVPICSPSRSQSVQMKRTSALRAHASMLLAIAFLSCGVLASTAERFACSISHLRQMSE